MVLDIVYRPVDAELSSPWAVGELAKKLPAATVKIKIGHNGVVFIGLYFVLSLRDVFDVEVAPIALDGFDDHAAVALVRLVLAARGPPVESG